MFKKRPTVQWMTTGAMIAALYVVLTVVANALGLSSGVIQLRFSEALTVLPVFTASAIPGVSVGCLLANLLTGCTPWDVVFGSVATLIGAVGTYLLRRHRVLAVLPPIVSNTVIVPFVLRYAYDAPGSIPYLMLTVGTGEVLSCGVLGLGLAKLLEPYRAQLF